MFKVHSPSPRELMKCIVVMKQRCPFAPRKKYKIYNQQSQEDCCLFFGVSSLVRLPRDAKSFSGGRLPGLRHKRAVPVQCTQPCSSTSDNWVFGIYSLGLKTRQAFITSPPSETKPSCVAPSVDMVEPRRVSVLSPKHWF